MASAIEREAIWTIAAGEKLQFDSRTRRSAELGERARRSMPDGVPMAWMAGLYGHRPLFVAHGEGCRFTDVDGTSYVDFNLDERLALGVERLVASSRSGSARP